ncbi:MAG: hypothetical protein JWM27_3622 [Gemmatimonadetes bacterium]|nr:hypothetical protein [Gemmatimonadota bacterium]
MIDIQERVEEAKLYEFLKRVGEVASHDPHRFVPSGDLGVLMGLPYEDAFRITRTLEERGLLRCAGELEPPHGPRVCVTRRGLGWLRERAA